MREFTVTIVDDIAPELNALMQAEGWSEATALRNALAAGLAVLRIERELRMRSGVAPDEKVRWLTRELADARSANAALRFQLFELSRDKQTLEFHLAGFRGQAEFQQRFIDTLKADVTSLQARIQHLEQRLARCGANGANNAEPGPPAGHGGETRSRTHPIEASRSMRTWLVRLLRRP